MPLLFRKIRIGWEDLKRAPSKLCCFTLCDHLGKLMLRNEMHQKGQEAKDTTGTEKVRFEEYRS